MLRKHFVAGALASLLAVPVVAQQEQQQAAPPAEAQRAEARLMKGASVAIEGCVTPGENDDTFVLGAVREIPGRPIETGMRTFYRLDSVDQLRGKAGQVVRVEGRIDGIDEGQIEVKPGKAKDGGILVELEIPGRDVDTRPAVVGVGTSGTTGDMPKTKITVIKLDVDKVTTVKESCS